MRTYFQTVLYLALLICNEMRITVTFLFDFKYDNFPWGKAPLLANSRSLDGVIRLERDYNCL